jgi:hypothetical protein
MRRLRRLGALVALALIVSTRSAPLALAATFRGTIASDTGLTARVRVGRLFCDLGGCTAHMHCVGAACLGHRAYLSYDLPGPKVGGFGFGDFFGAGRHLIGCPYLPRQDESSSPNCEVHARFRCFAPFPLTDEVISTGTIDLNPTHPHRFCP